MTTLRLPYVQAMKDRYGRPRYYFRRPGFKRVTLPGPVGSKAFMDAYQAALDERTAPKNEVAVYRTRPGSISALVVAYYASAEFQQLRPITQSTYRNVIDRFRAEHGDKPVSQLQSQHIRRILDQRAAKPAAANNLLKRLRGLLQFGVERGWCATNSALNIRRLQTREGGYRAWTDEDIAQFLDHWPRGSKPRLALLVLLYSAQRRADAVRFGRQHIKGGALHVRQQKTGRQLVIPIHADLQAELDLLPTDQLTVLQTEQGKPFTAAGFSNWFSERAARAGLPPRSSPHGLRKAAARWLAEAGCTAHEIAAITGHRSLSEVSLYTSSVDQAGLAVSAMASIKNRRVDQK